MISPPSLRARAPFFALLLLAMVASLTVCPFARAEPSEAGQKEAVAAMTKWLQGIDRGDFAPSWTDASKRFRDAVTQDQWIAALDQVRKPLGACSKRVLASALNESKVPRPGGRPLEGEFVIAQFQTSFANLFAAIETVTFEREKDGVWRASGYYIKPAS